MSYWLEKLISCDPDLAISDDAKILRKSLAQHGNMGLSGKELDAFIVVQCHFAQEDRQAALDAGDDDQAADEAARQTLLSCLPEELQDDDEDSGSEVERQATEEDAAEFFLQGMLGTVSRMSLQPGTSKQMDGKTYVLNDNHRWELPKQQDQDQAKTANSGLTGQGAETVRSQSTTAPDPDPEHVKIATAEQSKDPLSHLRDPRDKQFEAIIKLKGAQDRGDGMHFLSEAIMTPQRRRSLMEESEKGRTVGRITPTKLFEFKAWADVTGNPGDRGYAILDRRQRMLDRLPPPAASSPTTAPDPAQLKTASAEGDTPEHREARKAVSLWYLQNKAVYFDPKSRKMQPLDEDRVAGMLDGIDLSKPVVFGPPPSIPPPMRMVQWQAEGGNRGSYFSTEETTASELGIFDHAVAWNVEGTPVLPRKKTVYSTRNAKFDRVSYLQSVAAPTIDTWSVPGKQIAVDGGGPQWFVPVAAHPDIRVPKEQKMSIERPTIAQAIEATEKLINVAKDPAMIAVYKMLKSGATKGVAAIVVRNYDPAPTPEIEDWCNLVLKAVRTENE